MGVINRLDHRGHGPVAEWDRGQGEEVAAQVFAEHQAGGYTMFDISKGDGVKLDAFDPAAEEILAVPRMQAG
jgi:hypothetical protein